MSAQHRVAHQPSAVQPALEKRIHLTLDLQQQSVDSGRQPVLQPRSQHIRQRRGWRNDSTTTTIAVIVVVIAVVIAVVAVAAAVVVAVVVVAFLS